MSEEFKVEDMVSLFFLLVLLGFRWGDSDVAACGGRCRVRNYKRRTETEREILGVLSRKEMCVLNPRSGRLVAKSES